jgi:hypothetical protein
MGNKKAQQHCSQRDCYEKSYILRSPEVELNHESIANHRGKATQKKDQYKQQKDQLVVKRWSDVLSALVGNKDRYPIKQLKKRWSRSPRCTGVQPLHIEDG